jgi:casein kinase II subunit alpha
LWSVGCWFAAMIFKKSVFFKGEDNIDQLKKIGEIIGTTDIANYVKKYGLKPDQRLREWLQEEDFPKIPF